MIFSDGFITVTVSLGTSNFGIQPVQKIRNIASRFVLLASRHHHSTPLPEILHYLPISERIIYIYKRGCTSGGVIVQELCESRGGRLGLSVLTSLLVSVDVKDY